jgi:hypothetical protein
MARSETAALPPTRRAAAAERRALPAVWAVAAGLAFGAGIGTLVALGDGMWFFTDEWAFLLNRRELSAATLLAPHNEHWSTFPVLAYRGLFALGGLTDYRPYLVVAILLHAAATGAAWWLLRREGVPPLPALLAALSLLLMGAASEQLFNAFQLSWTAPLTLFLVALGLVDRERPRLGLDLLAAGLLVLAMPWSGVALALVAGLLLALLVHRQWLRSLIVPLPALAAYVVWRVGWGVSPPLSLEALLRVPAYIGYGLVSAVAGFTGLPRPAAIVVVVLVAAGIAAAVWRGLLSLTGTAAVLGLLAFFGSAGLARVLTLGVEQASSSRYLYIAMLLLLLGVAGAAHQLWAERTALPPVVLVAAGLALCLVVNVVMQLRAVPEVRADKAEVAAAVLTADRLLAAGEPAVPLAMPAPVFAPDVTVVELQELRAEDIPLDYDEPLPAAPSEADVRLLLRLALTPEKTVTADLAVVGGTAALGPVEGACADVTAQAGQSLELRAGGRLSLETDAEVPLHLRLGDPATTAPRPVTIQPGDVRQLELAEPADPTTTGPLSLGFPAAASLRLCGTTLTDERPPTP